jgi:hypothetical protein
MKLQRTILLGAAGGAVAVWLAAASPSSPSPSSQLPTHTPTPLELRGADLAAELARLHERLRPTATPLRTRDLFRYRRDAAAASASRRANAVVPPIEHRPDPLAVTKPSLALVGLAEDDGPDGPVRTAILKGAGDLFFVKEGDEVISRYRVEKISTDVVELTDIGGGRSLRLALR